MIFGDQIASPDTATAATWIAAECRGADWTVGALVPGRYLSVLRVHAPDPRPDGWWDAYRDLYEIVASIGERHTTSPERAWFAVWEGHGFDTSGLRQLPRFDRPHRTYFLLEGAVSAVTQLCHPEPSGEWRNPDLFWPDDRRWFVATDVDFWSLYIGGDHDFLAEVAASVPTGTEPVASERRLEVED